MHCFLGSPEVSPALSSRHSPHHPLASWCVFVEVVTRSVSPGLTSQPGKRLLLATSIPLFTPGTQPWCVSASNSDAITQACPLGTSPHSTVICPLPTASTSFFPMLIQKPFSKAWSFHCGGVDRQWGHVPAFPLTSGLTLGKSQFIPKAWFPHL